MPQSEESKVEAPEWTTVPSLKGTQLGALLVDLKEQMLVEADASTRIAAIRELIKPLVTALPSPVQAKAVGLRVAWVPEGKGKPTLDRGLLVQQGVTPDQIQAATKIGPPRKAYMVVTEIAVPDSSETPSAG